MWDYGQNMANPTFNLVIGLAKLRLEESLRNQQPQHQVQSSNAPFESFGYQSPLASFGSYGHQSPMASFESDGHQSQPRAYYQPLYVDTNQPYNQPPFRLDPCYQPQVPQQPMYQRHQRSNSSGYGSDNICIDISVSNVPNQHDTNGQWKSGEWQPTTHWEHPKARPAAKKVIKPEFGANPKARPAARSEYRGNRIPINRNRVEDNQIENNVDESDIMNPKHWTGLMGKPKRIPPPNYICHNCYHKGHYVENCPEPLPDHMMYSTYQGSKECMGEHWCKKCKRTWISQHSRSNQGESCKNCNDYVYPRKQLPHGRAWDSGFYDKPKFHRFIPLALKYLEEKHIHVSARYEQDEMGNYTYYPPTDPRFGTIQGRRDG